MAKSPILKVGRYAGKAIDTLPNSYLRWLITQKFPKNILDAANKKLMNSDYGDLYLNVTRHAIDMYSKRFLFTWIQRENYAGNKAIGLATFIAKSAQEAWDKGVDVSKHRHADDGIIKEYDGIQWVFGVNINYPEYKDVITVMPANEITELSPDITDNALD